MVLSSIRKKSGLLITVIGLAMLGFILTDLMSSGTSLFQKEQSILLKIDKQEINFTNFENELENNINIKFASNFGTANITESQRITERDLLWDNKIKKTLFLEKFNDSGITVSKAEAWDLISGEITGNQAQLFGYFFRDQTESGEWNAYNPEMIQSWIEIGSDNPQWPRYLFFKNNVIEEREFLKYYNAIKKGLYVTKQDAKSYYTEQTKSTSGKYIYIPFQHIELEQLNISEKEINQYYKNNKSEFFNSPNREITYFIFDLIPSDSDKKNIIIELSKLISDKEIFNKATNQKEIDLGFANTDDIENFINQHGDTKYEVIILSESEFKESTKELNINNGIIEPYFENEFCKMGRIIESDNDSVSIVYLEREIYTSDQTLNEIYSDVNDFIIKNKKIENFKEVAKEINTKPRTVNLAKMDQSVPGLGVNRQIVRWAFNDQTNVYEPKYFDLEDKYIVAILSKISESETQLLAEVSNDIYQILAQKKRAEFLMTSINNHEQITLQGLADNFNTQIKTINELRINSDNFSDQGYNPGIVGAFFGSIKNKISQPFIGENGVFVFEKEKEGSINYPSNFSRYKALIDKDYDTQVDLLLVDILKGDKKIIDNRFNFY